MARKAETIDNKALADYMLGYDNYSELSLRMKDCIEGSMRMGTGNPTNPVAIFRALQCLPEITFNSVKDYVNRKEKAISGKEFSERHAYYFYNRLKNAKRSIEYSYRGVLENYETPVRYTPYTH